MKKQKLTTLKILGFSLIPFLMVLYFGSSQYQGTSKIFDGRKPVYAEVANTGTTQYLPLIVFSDRSTEIELIDAWTSDTNSQPQTTFYLGDTIQYNTSGENILDEATSVELTWSQEGPCGTTEFYSDTHSLPAGAWQIDLNEPTPECVGDYFGRVKIDHLGYTSTLTTTFQVHLPSHVITNTQHAFDRCWVPTVNQMQTWWNSSPYYVWNIYLGGIHYFCPSGDLTAAWVQSVAQQGWEFILTWVGPQAPCSQFIHKFSGDPQDNYIEAFNAGIDEAAAALAAAESVGLSGEKIIYYDLEFYPSSDAECNQAVNYFLDGWTTWLQLQGDKSGVYASPCNSNMKDWINISPPPDDIWIAHWIFDEYEPTATVWDVACSLPNSYWADHQRIRQYAGDHTETWGGVSLTIDSNVLDGEITSITDTIPTVGSLFDIQNPEHLEFSRNRIQDMDLVSSQVGWVLQGDRLKITGDGGETWNGIMPVIGGADILDVEFINPDSGWLAATGVGSVSSQMIEIYQTIDGGETWISHPLPFSWAGIASVYLEFVNQHTGWALLKLKTGSSFSLGRLLATQDGGNTWEERSAPMGERVIFADEEVGWMAGGPAGNQIYRTEDGGVTWNPQVLPDLPIGHTYIGQPVFETIKSGVLPVTISGSPNARLMIYSTSDRGETWQMSQTVELPSDFEPGMALPFSRSDGRWWAATPDMKGLLNSAKLADEAEITTTTGLPPGVIQLDYVTREIGWALIQDNQCFGEKTSGNYSGPNAIVFSCSTDTRLYKTNDGGVRWYEVKP
jgi:photosystem II stability/assembly factor-like uncharacterized protein